jgi:hypothetical protein
MRYSEIIVPATHPHVVTIHIDPADFDALRRRMDDHPELRLLDYDMTEPGLWPVRVGCASAETAIRFEAAWG